MPEPMWRRYLRFWGPAPARDLDDELRFHLESKIDDLVAEGMSPEAAREEAARRFGPVEPVWKECYALARGRVQRALRAEYIDGWRRDLVYAVRVLGKTRGSTLAAVLILGITIGATTAVFTLLDRLLYKPLPVSNPSELVLLTESSVSLDGSRQQSGGSLSYPGYAFLRDNTVSFDGLVAEAGLQPLETDPREELSTPAAAHPVSGNFFEVLGVRALRGRALDPTDDTEDGNSQVAVASHAFWTARYGQSSDAIGSTVYLREVPFTIVGVLPADFTGTTKGRAPDLYIPLMSVPKLFGTSLLFSPTSHPLQVMGRLSPTSSLRRAAAEVNLGWGAFVKSPVFEGTSESARPDPATARIEVSGGRSGYGALREERRSSLILLAWIVGTIFLIGCFNVACLLLARGAVRRSEIAIRLSLGAGTWRILRQSLLESCLVATVGAAAGTAGTVWFGRLILAGLQWSDRAPDLTPDMRILTFGIGLTLATGAVCGLIPAVLLLKSARMTLNPARANDRVLSSFTPGRVLVVAEIALSLVLIGGAALFVRGFQNVRSIPLGFNAEAVSVVQLSAGPMDDDPGYFERDQILMEDSVRLAGLMREAPGMEALSMADSLPFGDGAVSYALTAIAGDESPASADAFVVRVDEEYFETLEIPILSGRAFESDDDRSGPAVAVLGRTLAGKLFPEPAPIGRRFMIGTREFEVVGIAGDIKHRSVKAPAPSLLYLPVRQPPPGSALMTAPRIQARGRMTDAELSNLAGEAIRNAGLRLSVSESGSLAREVGASYLDDRIRMQAASIFGALALALITAGVYSLMAYSVSQRSRELGVRIAIGATVPGIVRLVLTDGLRLVALGVVLGMPGAVAAMRVLSGFAYELAPVDVVSLVSAIVVLTLTGLAATLGPAARAASLDPADTIRVQ